MAISSSFQTHSVLTTISVTNADLLRGRMIRSRIPMSMQPSMRAESMMLPGMVTMKPSTLPHQFLGQVDSPQGVRGKPIRFDLAGVLLGNR